MGLMKELGIRASTGNREAIAALKRNRELLAEQKSLSDFPWAVPCSTELVENGCRVSPGEYEQMTLDLDMDPEPWPPEEREAFEAWLDAQSKQDEDTLKALDEEVPF